MKSNVVAVTTGLTIGVVAILVILVVIVSITSVLLVKKCKRKKHTVTDNAAYTNRGTGNLTQLDCDDVVMTSMNDAYIASHELETHERDIMYHSFQVQGGERQPSSRESVRMDVDENVAYKKSTIVLKLSFHTKSKRHYRKRGQNCNSEYDYVK